ncbi:MAG: hypothetical protein IJT62_03485 [Oscillospiraceae bacterium]|nr:hypothetical protein [Oscillospiraceae bacterium]
MNELEEKLSAVLSDPEELGRLTRMASALLGGAGDAGNEPPPQAEPERGGGLPPALGKMLRDLRGRGKPPLLEGVGPYLDPERRARLERALRLASTARLAGSAWEKMGGWDGL